MTCSKLTCCSAVLGAFCNSHPAAPPQGCSGPANQHLWPRRHSDDFVFSALSGRGRLELINLERKSGDGWKKYYSQWNKNTQDILYLTLKCSSKRKKRLQNIKNSANGAKQRMKIMMKMRTNRNDWPASGLALPWWGRSGPRWSSWSSHHLCSVSGSKPAELCNIRNKKAMTKNKR